MGRLQDAASPRPEAPAAPAGPSGRMSGVTTPDKVDTRGTGSVTEVSTSQHASGKAAADEIAEIFGSAKKRRRLFANEEKAQGATNALPVNKVQGNKNDIFGNGPTKARRRTNDGLPIYTEDELSINTESGNTPLCPFDCKCCY